MHDSRVHYDVLRILPCSLQHLLFHSIMEEIERSMNTGRDRLSVKSLSGKYATDEMLLSGLAENSSESARLAAVFWELVWPKLEESGWEKVG